MAPDPPVLPAPRPPFTTHDLFTDREQFIAAFHERVLVHGRRTFGVPELLDPARPAANLLSIVGEGGMGKSALVNQLAALAAGGQLAGLPKHTAAVVVDCADTANLSLENILLRIRGSVGTLGKSWRAIDHGLGAYWLRRAS